jgi:hypothetical protein
MLATAFEEVACWLLHSRKLCTVATACEPRQHNWRFFFPSEHRESRLQHPTELTKAVSKKSHNTNIAHKHKVVSKKSHNNDKDNT